MNLSPSQDSATQNDPLAERRRLQARARRLARRAQSLAGAGRMEEAIACQSEVAALRPDDPAAFLRLGLLYREARRIEPAVLALRRAACLSPAQRDPREALIATLLDGGRYKEIIDEGKALVKVAPRSLFARDVLSIAYLQLGQIEKALRMIGELIWLDPLNPDHYLKRAMLFQQQGNVKGAVGEYARVLEMTEEGSETYDHAGEALESLDDDQLRQIVLLATEDQLFQWKLGHDTTEAAQERGFFLSTDGFSRLRHIALNHLPEMTFQEPNAQVGRVRLYN